MSSGQAKWGRRQLHWVGRSRGGDACYVGSGGVRGSAYCIESGGVRCVDLELGEIAGCDIGEREKDGGR